MTIKVRTQVLGTHFFLKVRLMELRVLKYFLAVAKHENISRAATELNLTQPTLSRQIAELEDELGASLLTRGKRRTLLTEAGMLLKVRAEEIVSLTNKTVNQLANIDEIAEGDVYIGCGETEGMGEVVQAIERLHTDYPKIRIHLTSGNDELVTDGLQKGILDFGLLCSAREPVEYSYLQIPHQDVWGLYMNVANPLSKKQNICANDITSEPLIVSRQAVAAKEFDHWLKRRAEELNIAATYNLVYNAVFLIERGFGSVLSFKGLIPLERKNGKSIVFRPLFPELLSNNFIVWKKGQVFSRAGQLALNSFENAFS